MATKKKMIEIVKLLLDRGADINSRDKVRDSIQNKFNPITNRNNNTVLSYVIFNWSINFKYIYGYHIYCRMA